MYTVRHSHKGIFHRSLDTIFSLVRHLPPIFNHIPNLQRGGERQWGKKKRMSKRSPHFGSIPGNAKYWNATCSKDLNPKFLQFSDKTATLQGHFFCCAETMNIQFFHTESKKSSEGKTEKTSPWIFSSDEQPGGHGEPYFSAGERSEHWDLEEQRVLVKAAIPSPPRDSLMCPWPTQRAQSRQERSTLTSSTWLPEATYYRNISKSQEAGF